ncbi:MAG: hypothetical protein FWE58_02965 [Methanobrevibacter sp.]|nr:hypothetical protein [Methanobrevibacter sp.]
MFELSNGLKRNNYRFLLTFIVIIIGIMILSMINLSTVFAADTSLNPQSAGGIKEALKSESNTININLAEGTYFGDNNTKITIETGKTVTITGKNRDTTTINGGGINSIFLVRDRANLNLINLQIINARTSSNGAAIYNEGSGSITLVNCYFNNNMASGYGGVIYTKGLLDGGTSNIIHYTITNCVFNGNSASSGGAIYNSGGAYNSRNEIKFTISNSRFINNRALSTTTGAGGGAIYNYGGYSGSLNIIELNILNSNFDANVAAVRGGAIYNYGSADLSSNIIIVNVAGSTFSNNAANGGYGGAIYNFDGGNGASTVNNVIKSCVFSGNSVRNTVGGVISTGFGTVVYSNANNGFVNVNIEYSIFSQNIGGIEVFNSGASSKTTANNNWWGSNNIAGKSRNVEISTYFVIRLTSPNPNFSQAIGSSLTCVYTLLLNTGVKGAVNQLPNFTISINYNGRNVAAFNIKSDYRVSVVNNNDQNVFHISGTDRNPSLTIFNIKMPTTISLNNIVTTFGNTVTLTAVLRDANGKPVVGKDVSFFVSGKGIRIVKTNRDGVATCSYIATDFGGVKSWNVAFSGDNFYSAASNVGSISVARAKTKVSITKFVGKFNKKGTFSAKLINSQTKKAIPRKFVHFYSNGKLLTKVMTNNKGIAKLSVTFRYKGPVSLTVRHLGDNTCLPSRKSARNRIK